MDGQQNKSLKKTAYFSDPPTTRSLSVAAVILVLAVIFFTQVLFPAASCPFMDCDPSPSAFAFMQNNDGLSNPGHFSLQRSAHYEAARTIIGRWLRLEDQDKPGDLPDPETIVEYYRAYLAGVDLVFPIVYAAAGIALLKFFYHLSSRDPGWLQVLPIAGAAFDYLENAVHFDMIGLVADGSVYRIGDQSVSLAYIFSTIKIAFLIATVFLVLRALYLASLIWLSSRIKSGFSDKNPDRFNLSKRLPAALIVVVFGALSVMMINTMTLSARNLRGDANQCGGHIDLELANSTDGAQAIFECWANVVDSSYDPNAKSGSPQNVIVLENVADLYIQFLGLDWLFALVYAIALSALVSVLLYLSAKSPVDFVGSWFGESENNILISIRASAQELLALLPVLPWLVGYLDSMENFIHFDIIKTIAINGDAGTILPGQLVFAYALSLAKWIILVLFAFGVAITIMLLVVQAILWWQSRGQKEADAKPLAEDEFKVEKDYVAPNNYAAFLDRVVGDAGSAEFGYLNARRETAAQFLPETAAQMQQPASLGRKSRNQAVDVVARNAIGLSHSGGGIRSGSFNLGMQQGLSRFGILPWVDYISSVSGGGFAAAALTTLLSKKTEIEDDGKAGSKFHFYSHWERFPFNSKAKAFDRDADDLAGQGEPISGTKKKYLGVSNEPGLNSQLSYFRDKGNYLAPRLGWVTRDILRGIGAVFAKMGYTLILYLAIMLALSAFHYLSIATLTPAILQDIDGGKLTPAGEKEETSIVFDAQDSKTGVDITYTLKPTPSAVEADASNDATSQSETTFNLVGLVFGAYEDPPAAAAAAADGPAFPWGMYGWAIAAGATSATVFWAFVARFYWKYIDFKALDRRKKKLHENKIDSSNAEAKAISLEVDKVLKNIRRFAWFAYTSLATLVAVTIGAVVIWEPNLVLLQGAAFYWVWLGLLCVLLIAGFYYVNYLQNLMGSQAWAEGGLPPTHWMDMLFINISSGMFIGLMALSVIWIRFIFLPFRVEGPDIFLIWLLPLFWVGNLVGLVVFRALNRRQRVGEGNNQFIISVWSNNYLRSVFWTWEGLSLYIIVFLIALNLLTLPHYFANAASQQAGVASLLTAIISGGYAAYLTSLGSDSKDWQSRVQQLIDLPVGIRNYVLGVLVLIFILSTAFLMQTFLDQIAPGNLALISAIGAIAILIFALIGWRVNFNYITPHYFFRDRVAEYVMKTEVENGTGVVRTVRDDRFLRMQDVNPDGSSAPYHLVLTALNLPGSMHLKSKDRKSQHFIFSRHFTGSEITGYVRTKHYRAAENSFGLTKYAHAIALSGAAISSSVGHLTFFAQAFMTTLLNIRLGLWFTNPLLYAAKSKERHQTESRSFRTKFENAIFWPGYLWDELRGRTHERKELVNLSDGAFAGDNLALYPLFKRRCQVIIAGDASSDPNAYCESLFSVLQQVQTDFGVDVNIDVDALKPLTKDTGKHKSGMSQKHCSIGDITYPANPDRGLGEMKGWLVLIKPTVTGDEPATIKKYWETHKEEFPHPTTGDQFFDEIQFEAQRRLGEVTIEHILDDLSAYYKDQIKKRKDKMKEVYADLKKTKDEISIIKDKMTNYKKPEKAKALEKMKKRWGKHKKKQKAQRKKAKKELAMYVKKKKLIDDLLTDDGKQPRREFGTIFTEKLNPEKKENNDKQAAKKIFPSLDVFMEDLRESTKTIV
ncbi:MAG: hypothetical protein DWQ07_17310 [Chloroflexi bacterium]|nr:MAG: hypothetical protein DWQ07_17310 [Chloroflexota bacterium]MBL1195164.1 hypothetical protein [Chloroflexota bacterium]NOH12448.1 hypothetical protein [Chloroflexota bacterium]